MLIGGFRGPTEVQRGRIVNNLARNNIVTFSLSLSNMEAETELLREYRPTTTTTTTTKQP